MRSSRWSPRISTSSWSTTSRRSALVASDGYVLSHRSGAPDNNRRPLPERSMRVGLLVVGLWFVGCTDQSSPVTKKNYASLHWEAHRRACGPDAACPDGWDCFEDRYLVRDGHQCHVEHLDAGDITVCGEEIADPTRGFSVSYCLFPCTTVSDCSPDEGGEYFCSRAMTSRRTFCGRR